MGRIQSDLGRIQSDLGRIQLGLGVLKSFNGGVEKFQSRRWTFSMGVLKNQMVALKRVNGGIEKIRWGYCVGSQGALGGIGGMEKGSMVALKRGVGQGQWGY